MPFGCFVQVVYDFFHSFLPFRLRNSMPLREHGTDGELPAVRTRLRLDAEDVLDDVESLDNMDSKSVSDGVDVDDSSEANAESLLGHKDISNVAQNVKAGSGGVIEARRVDEGELCAVQPHRHRQAALCARHAGVALSHNAIAGEHVDEPALPRTRNAHHQHPTPIPIAIGDAGRDRHDGEPTWSRLLSVGGLKSGGNGDTPQIRQPLNSKTRGDEFCA